MLGRRRWCLAVVTSALACSSAEETTAITKTEVVKYGADPPSM